MTIALNKPVAPDIKKLTKYLERVNESGWYTNFGPLHQLLTKRLEEYLGVENLLLVSNGTLAIQVACKVLGVKSALTTPFSFVATSSSLLWQGIDVAFSDIDAQSYNLDPQAVDNWLLSNQSIDSVVATHVYGNPCDVKSFENISKKHNVKVIYDAAHAFAVDCNGQSVLKYGDASTLSFHATKVFHTVEGGAIVFKRKEDYLKAKQLINFGIQKDGGLGEPGINAKLNEYQCAVGLTILDEIDNILAVRKALFESYSEQLESVVKMPKWHEFSTINGAYLPIVLNNESEKEKVKVALSDKSIQSRDYFSPSLNTVYSDIDMPISERAAKEVLCLPLHFHMTKEDVKAVCEIVLGVCR